MISSKALGNAVKNFSEALDKGEGVVSEWTAQRVRDELPHVTVQFADDTRADGFVIWINPEGFAVIGVHVHGSVLTAGEWSMNALVNRLNKGGALLV